MHQPAPRGSGSTGWAKPEARRSPKRRRSRAPKNAASELSELGLPDNAPAESFFDTLKDELDIGHGRVFASTENACTVIGEYIEHFYNRQRWHSYSNYLSPVDFEAESGQVARVA